MDGSVFVYLFELCPLVYWAGEMHWNNEKLNIDWKNLFVIWFYTHEETCSSKKKRDCRIETLLFDFFFIEFPKIESFVS